MDDVPATGGTGGGDGVTEASIFDGPEFPLIIEVTGPGVAPVVEDGTVVDPVGTAVYSSGDWEWDCYSRWYSFCRDFGQEPRVAQRVAVFLGMATGKRIGLEGYFPRIHHLRSVADVVVRGWPNPLEHAVGAEPVTIMRPMYPCHIDPRDYYGYHGQHAVEALRRKYPAESKAANLREERNILWGLPIERRT